MLIRPSTVDDAETLADLHLEVWDEAYTNLVPAALLAARRANRASRIDRWRDILVSRTSTELLAQEDEDGGRLLGFASTSSGRDDPEPALPDLELMGQYVRAEVYGTGVGYALMMAVTGNAAAYLWVLDGNTRGTASTSVRDSVSMGRSRRPSGRRAAHGPARQPLREAPGNVHGPGRPFIAWPPMRA